MVIFSEGIPQIKGQRKKGRPKKSWTTSVGAEVNSIQHSWGIIQWLAVDHAKWREFVALQDTFEW